MNNKNLLAIGAMAVMMIGATALASAARKCIGNEQEARQYRITFGKCLWK